MNINKTSKGIFLGKIFNRFLIICSSFKIGFGNIFCFVELFISLYHSRSIQFPLTGLSKYKGWVKIIASSDINKGPFK